MAWGLFGKAECPVDEAMRDWIDARFRWLQEQLGENTTREVRVVLPTPEFFPDVYENKPEHVQAIFDRIAGYMGVDPARLKMHLFDDSRPDPTGALGGLTRSTPAGLYYGRGKATDSQTEPARIGIGHSCVADPMVLVATIAHEIAHEILLGQKRVSNDEADHEPLTDLTTVFLGLGIFGGNATIRDHGWSNGTWTGWSTSRLGYLNQRMFGYALARFARTRGETRPPWMKHVRLDVRAPLKQGLRYIESVSRQSV